MGDASETPSFSDPIEGAPAHPVDRKRRRLPGSAIAKGLLFGASGLCAGFFGASLTDDGAPVIEGRSPAAMTASPFLMAVSYSRDPASGGATGDPGWREEFAWVRKEDGEEHRLALWRPEDHKVVPPMVARWITVEVHHGDRKAILTPAELESVAGIPRTEGGPNGASLQLGGPGRPEQSEHEIVIPGFKPHKISLGTTTPDRPRIDLVPDGILTLVPPGGGKDLDFKELRFTSGADPATLQGRLVGTSFTLDVARALQADELSIPFPSGRYEVAIEDGLFANLKLDPGSVRVESTRSEGGGTPLELPPAIGGIHLGRKGTFRTIVALPEVWGDVEADAVIWITNDQLGPRFMCFQSQVKDSAQGKTYVSGRFGAPLQFKALQRESTGAMTWQFELAWKRARELHEQAGDRDEDFLEVVAGFGPSTVSLTWGSSGITCEFLEEKDPRFTDQTRGKWSAMEEIGNNREEGRSYFDVSPLTRYLKVSSEERERVPFEEISMEKWFPSTSPE